MAKPSNERQANYARWLNQWDPGSDEALAAAEKAVAMNASSANAQVAMAEVLAAETPTRPRSGHSGRRRVRLTTSATPACSLSRRSRRCRR